MMKSQDPEKNNNLIRKSELNLVVGINGTGKSTFLMNNFVLKSKKSLVVTPDPQEWQFLPLVTTADEIYNLEGSARIIYEGKETLELIKNYFYGGNLILDDAMAYLDQQTPAMLQYLYIRRRQWGIDLFITAHGLRQLPPKCFSFASWLFLFYTTENFQTRKKDIQDDVFNKIINGQKRVAQKIKTGKANYEPEIILLDESIRFDYERQRKNNR